MYSKVITQAVPRILMSTCVCRTISVPNRSYIFPFSSIYNSTSSSSSITSATFPFVHYSSHLSFHFLLRSSMSAFRLHSIFLFSLSSNIPIHSFSFSLFHLLLQIKLYFSSHFIISTSSQILSSNSTFPLCVSHPFDLCSPPPCFFSFLGEHLCKWHINFSPHIGWRLPSFLSTLMTFAFWLPWRVFLR